MRSARRRVATITFSALFALAMTVCGPDIARADERAKREAATTAALARAFERERALLEAEREALEQELAKQRRAARRRESALSGRLRRATERLSRMRTRASALEEEAGTLERALGTRTHEGALLHASLDQALETLARHGVTLDLELTPETDNAILLEGVFTAGAALVERFRSVVRDEGDFFLSDGRETAGTIFRIGRFAAIGISEEGGGVLGPAGAGRLVVVNPERRAEARALAQGNPPAMLPLYLFPPGAPSIEAAEEAGLSSFLRRGGFLVWPIVFLAALVVLLLIERCFTLLLARTGSRNLIKDVVSAVDSQDHSSAEVMVARRGGALARVLSTALNHRGAGREVYEDAVGRAMQRERLRLERFLPAMQVIAGAAPLLGLLGTVTGMITTFDVITDHGTGDPKLLSGGISEALITTQLGLGVAIPTLLLHGVLAGWAARHRASLERAILTASVSLFRAPAAGPLQAPEEAGGQTPRADPAAPPAPAPAEDESKDSRGGAMSLALATAAARERGTSGR